MTQTAPVSDAHESRPAADGADLPPLAFITGCGRSGTTILGRLLESHEDVRYLNDRFDLWIRPFPVADIWGRHIGSAKAGARVLLTAEDAKAVESSRDWFRGLLAHERGDKRLIVEKLAINNFRLGFLMALCPEAALINITRHGVEVACSIEQRALAGHWYGLKDRKWTLLVEYAWAHGYGKLLPLCTTPYHRGLLEWRMSVDAADAYLATNPPARLLRLRYEDLLEDAPGVAARLREFLGLPPSESMDRFAAEEIGRKSPPATERPIPPGTEEIAGEALRRLGYWT